ncbi:MAG: hypothetical protein CK424_02545 [Legionella sp.]|nr:MAG: hypothetical protein CK424_02545 [Legionella sp.]
MMLKHWLFAGIGLIGLYVNVSDASLGSATQPFYSQIRSIPKSLQTQMKQYTWHKDCPVTLEQLAYVELSYWGFDRHPHQGALIVSKDLAQEVVDIFQTLFQQQFLIQSMMPIEQFYGNEMASMAANNTSAFHCRPVTDRPYEFSQHSYGRAIDINPVLNPYINIIKTIKILPAQGEAHLNRNEAVPGKIIEGDMAYQAFITQNWDWGGYWYDVKDYQHFEKRANGEKRNIYGYDDFLYKK